MVCIFQNHHHECKANVSLFNDVPVDKANNYTRDCIPQDSTGARKSPSEFSEAATLGDHLFTYFSFNSEWKISDEIAARTSIHERFYD